MRHRWPRLRCRTKRTNNIDNPGAAIKMALCIPRSTDRQPSGRFVSWSPDKAHRLHACGLFSFVFAPVAQRKSAEKRRVRDSEVDVSEASRSAKGQYLSGRGSVPKAPNVGCSNQPWPPIQGDRRCELLLFFLDNFWRSLLDTVCICSAFCIRCRFRGREVLSFLRSIFFDDTPCIEPGTSPVLPGVAVLTKTKLHGGLSSQELCDRPRVLLSIHKFYRGRFQTAILSEVFCSDLADIFECNFDELVLNAKTSWLIHNTNAPLAQRQSVLVGDQKGRTFDPCKVRLDQGLFQGVGNTSSRNKYV